MLVEKNLTNWKRVGNKVILNSDYLVKGLDSNNKWGKFKKITGTRFSAIFGLSKYNSEFKIWMGMVNLFKDDMDPTLSLVGNTVEPLLKHYAEENLKNEYLTHDPMKISFDAFSNNKVFGGIPDGEPLINGQINYSTGLPMLEIKTSSIDKFSYKTENGALKMQKDSSGLPIVSKVGEKKKEWFDQSGEIHIPVEYQFQLSLYLYLRNITKGMFVVGFLEKEDYVNPKEFNAHDRDVRLVEFNLKDVDGFKQYINKALEWYDKYIVSGQSPGMKEDDIKWLEKELVLVKN